MATRRGSRRARERTIVEEIGYKSRKEIEVKKEIWFTTITTDYLMIPIKLTGKKSSKFLCFFRAIAIPKVIQSYSDLPNKDTVIYTLLIP